MKIVHLALCAAALLSTTLPSAAKLASAKDQARARAERACYLDAKALCPDAIPDESKVTACFTAKRPQLSEACGAIFDKGI
ncbi:MAG: hypothetical protein ACRYGP_25615 [Janthinobacterium lividum]